METILNSPIISKYLSQEKIDSYKKDMDRWLEEFEMDPYFGLTDHFAIKVENETALIELTEAFKPYCVDHIGDTSGLSTRKMHGRAITVALLKNPIMIGGHAINCVEIMQPKPHNEGKDLIGLDHLEIINTNLKLIEKHLKERGADHYVDETNPYKGIIVSFVNNKKEQIKFTNKTLAEIVPQQIKDEPERVTVIKNNNF